MQGCFKEKVPAFVAHLMQRLGSVLSASALRTPNGTCKLRDAPCGCNLKDKKYKREKTTTKARSDSVGVTFLRLPHR